MNYSVRGISRCYSSCELVMFKRLKVAVDEEDVSPFDINERWGRIRKALFGSHTHDVFDPGI